MRCPELSVHTAAAQYGDELAVVEGERGLSFRELSSEVARAQEDLQGRLLPGRRVALVARPDLRSLILLSAVLEEGSVPCFLHPRLPAETRALLAGRVGAAMVPGLTEDAAEQTTVPPAAALRERSVSSASDLALFFTSGSTELPKGVRLSSRAFVASAVASERNLGWREDDRWLCSLPLAHIGGFSVLTRTRLAGRTLVLPEPRMPAGFDPSRFVEQLARRRITLASLVPTMLARLIRAGLAAPATLRAVLIGGAALDPELAQAARELGWPTLASYGLTEACSQVATQRPGAPWAAGSGMPLSGLEVDVADGEIRLRGPALFSGYVPEEAPPFDDDGWFRTGDLGRFDAQGHLLVEGRARDLVITGGENVAPGRVEAVLRGLAEVEEVVVMGLPDREWGEVVAAVLVAPAADPCVLAPKRLRNRLEGRLAGFERPRRVFLASSLPLLPNGKIDRGEIRRRAQGSGFAELSDDLA